MAKVVEKTKENLKKCICMSCPSYTTSCKFKEMPGNVMTMVTGKLGKAKHFEGMFCAYEKSNCITEKNGCNCSACVLERECGLDHGYFCLKDGGL